MLATLLLLAQLVLPGPPSGPIQPPGMICLGECAGPVVWGPAERGRLVVACDMRSDTCSDGRKITTVRASPVPCETSPGVWEMVPENTGCYGVRGLESWGATTTYLSYGAELDRSPWRAVDGATVQSLPTGGYLVIGTRESSRIFQLIPPEAGVWTFSCIMRTDEPETNPRLQIYWGQGAVVQVPVTSTWATYSITRTVPESAQELAVHVYSGVGTVDVIGCWFTKTSVPGRACWGGEAPVTCAADRHTISTEGWPTEAGEVCIRFGFDHASSANRYLLDSREGGEGVSLHLSDERIVGRTYHQGSQVSITGPPVPIGTHIACLEWDATTLRLRFDGQLIGESPHSPPASHRAAATVGYDTGGGSYFNGSIRSLTVRSYKEVSQ